MKEKFYILTLAFALITAYAIAQGGPYSGTSPSGAPQGTPPTVPDASQQAPSTDQTSPSSRSQDRDRNMSKKATVDDQTLEQQVKQQLSSDPAFSSVDVKAKNGVVTLTGSVANQADRKRAKKLAHSVSGVTRVKEKLSISASAKAPAAGTQTVAGATAAPASASAAGMTSSDVKSQIETAIRNEPTLVGNAVNVSVTDSNVVLSGTVNSASDQQKVLDIAQQHAGTRQVLNQLTLSGSSAAAAGASTTTGGVSGTATSAAPASSTSGTSGAVAGQAGTSGTMGGVSGSATTAAPSTSTSTGTSGAIAGQAGTSGTGATAGVATGMESSVQLQSKIQQALLREPTLSSSNINVKVTDTTVELTGSAPSSKEKETARRIAQSFARDRQVVDHINVSGGAASSTGVPDRSISNQPSTTSPDNSNVPKSNPQNQGDQSSQPK